MLPASPDLPPKSLSPIPQVAPYGAWTSPITSELIVAQTIGFGQLAAEGETIYWLEQRPNEAGRNAIVRWQAGVATDLTPAPWNARSRVHEYGGGALTVHGESVYFINAADQQIYTLRPNRPPDSSPTPLTATPTCRYANGCPDPSRPRQVWVQEEYAGGPDDPHAVNNRLVSVSIGETEPGTQVPGTVSELIAGADFYASPCFSADGTWLAWLSWNQPAMPWESTELWVAPVQDDGTLGTAQLVAGGESESVFQPRWASDGSLIFVSDRSNWWNLYRWQPETGITTALLPMSAEFGLPQWVFAQSTYALVGSGLVCTYNRENLWSLGYLDLTTGKFQEIPTPYTDITGLQSWAGGVVFLAGSATQPTAVVRLAIQELANGGIQVGEPQVLRQSSQLSLPTGYFSQPEPICFPGESGQPTYAFYYPPQNQDFTAPSGVLPPLLVRSHGGPTAASGSTLNLTIQYWTSRGFALLDVNYSGSTGYGREYCQRLQGQWGILDVSDCIQAAQYAVAQGWADPERLIIRGSSAGGYTTLAALTFAKVFKAGASYYGISDLEALALDTHKFEARYFDGLIGPYPEAREFYRQRSPIHFVENLSCPVIFFQGLEDKVVPPNQAEQMVSALISKGLPTAYVVFPNEQHGFRRAENIQRTLESELYFYAQVFGFFLAGDIPPVEIHNLPPRSWSSQP